MTRVSSACAVTANRRGGGGGVTHLHIPHAVVVEVPEVFLSEIAEERHELEIRTRAGVDVRTHLQQIATYVSEGVRLVLRQLLHEWPRVTPHLIRLELREAALKRDRSLTRHRANPDRVGQRAIAVIGIR